MTTPTVFDQTESNNTSMAIDFDDNDLAAGTAIADPFTGVYFSSSSESELMLFDTENVMGEDFDLSTSDLGKVLIISEDDDSTDSDDNSAGGAIGVEFEELVTVNSIGLLDIDEPGSSIAFYDDEANLIDSVEIESLGDNSFQEIDFNVDNVASLEINLVSGGAVTGLDFSTQPNPYNNIYVFGDSLSDMGNLFNATTATQEFLSGFGLDFPVLPPSPPYFEGRFSNGPVWVEKLAEELDIELTPATELSVVSPDSEILSPITTIEDNPVVSPFFNGNTVNQSVNFAYGSAETGANGTSELGDFVPGMARQVEFFIDDHLQANQTADEDALYILWGGSNDYLAPNPDPEQIVDNLETQVESLYGSGARNFLIVNLPDLGRVPEANNPDLGASPEELTELVDTHNYLLDSTFEELSDTLTGADFTILDINSVFDEILSNPEEFGFTNVTEPLLDPITLTPTVGANPDEYFFFDTLHPTEPAHDIISNTALTALDLQSEVML